MIELRHVGVYVSELERMETFYKNVFLMTVIQSRVFTENSLLDELLGNRQAIISKLITPYGGISGTGDMVELVEVCGENAEEHIVGEVFIPGTAHIAFGVDDISATVDRVIKNGGCRKTSIVEIGINKCCFCVDPEGNWLELIQRGKV